MALIWLYEAEMNMQMHNATARLTIKTESRKTSRGSLFEVGSSLLVLSQKMLRKQKIGRRVFRRWHREMQAVIQWRPELKVAMTAG
jgi:hypothetical protein